MLVFWLLAAVMLAVALVFVLPPLLSGRGAAAAGDDERVARNVELYRERMATLDAEHAAGEIDDESLQEARVELQRELLHDAPPAPASRAPRRCSPRWWRRCCRC